MKRKKSDSRDKDRDTGKQSFRRNLHLLDPNIENQVWTAQNLSIPKLFR